MRKLNPLKILARNDKWFLGGGQRLLWAPPFPENLDFPGFWDKAQYYNFGIEPVFTWTILDGEEIPLKVSRRRWDPSKLECELTVADNRTRPKGLSFHETRCCLPNDVLASVVSIRNSSTVRRKLDLVAWTCQKNLASGGGGIESAGTEGQTIHFRKKCERPNRFEFDCAMSLGRKADSVSIQASTGAAIQPRWKYTPFAEKFKGGKLPDERNFRAHEEGLTFMAIHIRIDLARGVTEKIPIFFTAAPSRAEALGNLRSAGGLPDPVKLSEENWTDYFADVPYFECSEEVFTRYYWYRWYGLKLSSVLAGEGNYMHPFVCEGINEFRAPISYSAPCHILETRWMHSPERAEGVFLTFSDNQRSDGLFPGYIDISGDRADMFYHAHWGFALENLLTSHPSGDFMVKAFESLKKYAGGMERERGGPPAGLYDIVNQCETGQEYSPRYLAVDPNADRSDWGKIFRLKGVDVTVYMYSIMQALAGFAEELGEDSAEWREKAEEIKGAVLSSMWDSSAEMFFDVDPSTGQRTGVKAVTCFYPYMTDIVSAEHLPGLKRHLFNPKEFWTPFPVPSLSADNEYFSENSEWKGKRVNCAWNGRVWPMTCSHIAEALATCAIRFADRDLENRTVEFLQKLFTMVCAQATGPNSFEHYNPMSGEASFYRGIDDYQHSWMVDLLLKYVAGIRPHASGFEFRPLPFKLKEIVVDDLVIQGKRVRLRAGKGRFRLWVNGRLKAECKHGDVLHA